MQTVPSPSQNTAIKPSAMRTRQVRRLIIGCSQECGMDVLCTPSGIVCGIASVPSNAQLKSSTPSVVGQPKASVINMEIATALRHA